MKKNEKGAEDIHRTDTHIATIVPIGDLRGDRTEVPALFGDLVDRR